MDNPFLFPVIGPALETISAIWEQFMAFIGQYTWLSIAFYLVVVGVAISLFWMVFGSFSKR